MKFIRDNSVETKTNNRAFLQHTLTMPKRVSIILSDMFMSATIIIKSTIGAGIIALPFTISRLGYILTPIIFILFFLLNQYASVLLLKSKNLSRHSNFATIMHYIWPYDRSHYFGSALIFLDNFGTGINA